MDEAISEEPEYWNRVRGNGIVRAEYFPNISPFRVPPLLHRLFGSVGPGGILIKRNCIVTGGLGHIYKYAFRVAC